MKYCNRCGAQITDDSSRFCPNCGNDTMAPVNVAAPREEDKPNAGFAVLGFFLPLIGLILYLVWKSETPLKAKSCLNGAIAGFITGIVLVVLISIIAAIIGASFFAHFGSPSYYY